FFFSSRRRHTRLQGDWSSDVCSSDLERESARFFRLRLRQIHARDRRSFGEAVTLQNFFAEPRRKRFRQFIRQFFRAGDEEPHARSEERRVGKGVDSGGRRIIKKKNNC